MKLPNLTFSLLPRSKSSPVSINMINVHDDLILFPVTLLVMHINIFQPVYGHDDISFYHRKGFVIQTSFSHLVKARSFPSIIRFKIHQVVSRVYPQTTPFIRSVKPRDLTLNSPSNPLSRINWKKTGRGVKEIWLYQYFSDGLSSASVSVNRAWSWKPY